MKMFRVLIFGDIVAKPGRKAIAAVLSDLKKKYHPHLTIANAENLAHGIGATAKTLDEMRTAGVDFFTSGNHIWSKKEARTLLDAPDPVLIRPANYPPGVPGVGARLLVVGETPVLIANVQGRVFMGPDLDCPFRGLDAILAREERRAVIRIVDFHAEASSEKIVFGHYADGRVSVVVGTHSHVPTADSHILPKGTAYVTDVGMTGLRDAAIGADLAHVTRMFLTQIPASEMHDAPESGTAQVNAVVVDIDAATGKAYSIERVQREVVVG